MTAGLRAWAVFAGTLAVEIGLIVLLAEAAGRFFRGARLRLCWQAALMAAGFVLAADFLGVSASSAVWAPTNATRHRRVLVVTDEAMIREGKGDLPEAKAKERSEGVAAWPAWLWIAGTAAWLGLGATGRIWLWVERRKMTPAPAGVVALAEPLLTGLGVARARVCRWRRTGGPIAFGLLRPTVALPLDFEEGFSAQQQRVMLAHELAHLAGHDPFWFGCMDIFAALVWWHPLAWWMRRRFRQACEAAADRASALVPEGRRALAESLVTFGQRLSLSGFSGGLGVAGRGIRSELGLRVKALLEESTAWEVLPGRWRWGGRIAALGCAAALAASPVHADNPGAWLISGGVAKAEAPPARAGEAKSAPEPAAGDAALSKALSHPPITISVCFTELSEKDKAINELDRMFDRPGREAKAEDMALTELYPKLKLPSARNVILEPSRTEGPGAILGAEAFAAIKKRLMEKAGVDWLAAPKITFEAGRKGRVAAEDLKTIVFDAEAVNGTSSRPAGSINYVTADVPVGVMADMSTEVEGSGVRLNLLARDVEFLGFDDPGAGVVHAADWANGGFSPNPVKGVLPRPHFRARESSASAILKPGQTVVLRGPLALDSLEKRGDFLRAVRGEAAAHRLYVFATLESVGQ